MARKRDIKPGFFRNEYLTELPPLARLLFAGLWCYADREGRLMDRPRKIKVDILPYDNCDINELLNMLADSKEKFITRYEVDGERYIQINNFTEHQNNIHPREPESLIPAPLRESSCKPLQNTYEPLQDNDEYTTREVKEVKEVEEVEEVKETEEAIQYGEIIEYLNKRTNASYRANSQKTKQLIKARFKEKFTFENFMKVIDNKADEWLGTDMEKYLRPETLFGTKFEGYLNQRKPPGNKNKPAQQSNFEQRTYSDDYYEKLYKNGG